MSDDSPDPRRFIDWAREEAHRPGDDRIGTHHILLALVQEGSGGAASVWTDLGLDPNKVRHEVERLVSPGAAPVPRGQLPFTPRAVRVLKLSFEEAAHLGHAKLDEEHILLGLIRMNEGIAVRVLRNLNVDLVKVRDRVLDSWKSR